MNRSRYDHSVKMTAKIFGPIWRSEDHGVEIRCGYVDPVRFPFEDPATISASGVAQPALHAAAIRRSQRRRASAIAGCGAQSPPTGRPADRDHLRRRQQAGGLLGSLMDGQPGEGVKGRSRSPTCRPPPSGRATRPDSLLSGDFRLAQPHGEVAKALQANSRPPGVAALSPGASASSNAGLATARSPCRIAT